MSHTPSLTTQQSWWSQLGLTFSGQFADREAYAVLQGYRPTQFVSAAADNSTNSPATDDAVFITWDELLDQLATAQAAATARLKRARDAETAVALADYASAHHYPDSSTPVTEGRWIGFTHGEARAWLFTLFEYERRGLVHPGSEVRARAINATRAGELPEVFGYPERARELADRGLNPDEYRRVKALVQAGK